MVGMNTHVEHMTTLKNVYTTTHIKAVPLKNLSD